MKDAILTINAGSSSIKFALFENDGGLARIAAGEIEKIGTAPHFSVRNMQGDLVKEQSWPHGEVLTHEALLAPLLDWVEHHLGDAELIAAGHRIVHGGAAFSAPVRLDDTTLRALAKLNPLAPLHEPHNLAAVQAVLKLRPKLPQIGCFDTAFHHTIAPLETRFALPRHFHDEGVRRYGFHGLSYAYIAQHLHDLAPALAQGRVIAAHLGNGASVCAMLDGKSVDSSMGFTALDGLMMGTRCGSIDAGAVLYMMQANDLNTAQMTELLYNKSGLRGVSGLTADMRDLLNNESPEATEAVALFALFAARHVCSLMASLGGLDGLVFTAGIGEHTPAVRSLICARLGALGVVLDEAANAVNAPVISAAASRVEVRVIHTDEEAMIARQCQDTIAAG